MSDDVPEDKGAHDLADDGSGGLVLLGWRPHAHYGAIQLDTQAPSEARGADLAQLISAAPVSQAAMDSAGAAVWPTWWSGLPVGTRAVLRRVLRRLAVV